MSAYFLIHKKIIKSLAFQRTHFQLPRERLPTENVQFQAGVSNLPRPLPPFHLHLCPQGIVNFNNGHIYRIISTDIFIPRKKEKSMLVPASISGTLCVPAAPAVNCSFYWDPVKGFLYSPPFQLSPALRACNHLLPCQLVSLVTSSCLHPP